MWTLLLLVCAPLPALLRVVPFYPLACRPPAPAPPPAGQPQTPSQLQATVPQAAPGAKPWYHRWVVDPPLWLAKLFGAAVTLCLAAGAFQRGDPDAALVYLLIVLVILLPPWRY